jgi:hypothetical protein
VRRSLTLVDKHWLIEAIEDAIPLGCGRVHHDCKTIMSACHCVVFEFICQKCGRLARRSRCEVCRLSLPFLSYLYSCLACGRH